MRFEAIFGSKSFKLLEKFAVSETSNTFLMLLTEGLKHLDAITRSMLDFLSRRAFYQYVN